MPSKCISLWEEDNSLTNLSWSSTWVNMMWSLDDDGSNNKTCGWMSRTDGWCGHMREPWKKNLRQHNQSCCQNRYCGDHVLNQNIRRMWNNGIGKWMKKTKELHNTNPWGTKTWINIPICGKWSGLWAGRTTPEQHQTNPINIWYNQPNAWPLT